MPGGSINSNANALLGAMANGTPVTISLSTSSDSVQMAPGLTRVISDVDCYIKQGGSTVTAVASMTGGAYLPAGVEMWLYADAQADLDYLAGIVASGTGDMQALRV